MRYNRLILNHYSLMKLTRCNPAKMLFHSHKIDLYRLLLPRFGSTKSSCRNCRSLQILYFGSDEFSIGPLKKLVSQKRQNDPRKEKIENIEVVTSEPPLLERVAKKQKSSKFLEYIKQENLKIHPWNKDTVSKLSNYDIGIVASFGHLIPSKVIKVFNRGMINAHPSLLPRWRGAAPIIHTILNGDKKTGVTIIDLSVGRFDKGKIFKQKEIEVSQNCTNEMLTETLSTLAAEMILDVLDDYDNYKANAKPQIEDGASKAPKISTDLSYIKWQDQNCIEIDRLYRGIGKKIGLHTYFEGRLVKLVKIKPLDESKSQEIDTSVDANFVPGRSWFDRKTQRLYIRCTDGWMEVVSLQMQYKKPVRPVDFYNAYMVDRKKTGDFKDLFHSNLTDNIR